MIICMNIFTLETQNNFFVTIKIKNTEATAICHWNTEQLFGENSYDKHRSICHLPFKEQDSDLAVTEEKEDENLEDTKED